MLSSTADQAAETGSTMPKKLLIIAGAALLLLGGGGAGLHFSGMLGTKAPVDQQAEEKKKEAERAAAAPVFLQLEPLTAPVMEGNRLRQQIILTLSVEFASTDARDDLLRKLPRLRDAMLRDLFAESILRADGTGAIDLDELKARMLQVARGVVGGEQVRNILVVKAVRIG